MLLTARDLNDASQGSPWPLLMRQLSAALQSAAVHPAHAVVLVPYAQLMAEAKAAWAAHGAATGQTAGFMPRFESTMNWAQSLAEATQQSANDIQQDAALDALTAAQLLTRAGLGQQNDMLQARLVEAAWSLVRVAAAQHPASRLAWGASLASQLGLGLESGYLALESAVSSIALAWAASSSYPTDVLFTQQPPLLVVIEGLQADPMADALQKQCSAASATFAFAAPKAGSPDSDPQLQQHRLHAALDAEDEAERAAACVLDHLAQGRKPVALIAQDRVLTRRIGALLVGRNVLLRDETGWTLSTARAAATLMGFLRAMQWNASTDAVLDWLKNAPAYPQKDVDALESALRKLGVRFWRDVPPVSAALDCLLSDVQTLRSAMQSARLLADWLHDVRHGLQTGGQWDAMAGDAAGKSVLAALHLNIGSLPWLLDATPSNPCLRMSAQDFVQWASHALESGIFSPEHPAQAQVVLLPLAQLLGRSMAAVVLPGCDEIRLPASPDPPGHWTPRQRALLGLPSRADLAAAQRAAWAVALARPHLDVLWRQSEAGEHLMPSGFVQELLLSAKAGAAQNDPRVARSLPAQPTLPSQPSAAALLALRPTLSASAYEDLRSCPYRFFALRLLRLQEADELESELGKRDFGNWLHVTLHLFHEALKAASKQAPAPDLRAQTAMINAASEQASVDLALSPSEFLPFAAIWPRTRDGYLTWLAAHQASGAQYSAGEVWQTLSVGSVALSGKLDRIDVMPDGSRIVMDYKTEALEKTKARIKSAQEDTQLAFYAALLPDDTLAAAYVNLGEKQPTQDLAQKAIVKIRDALILGIVSDMRRIADQSVLPALGEGAACEFCAASGICRKDFWTR